MVASRSPRASPPFSVCSELICARTRFHTHLLKPAAVHLIQGHAFPYIKRRGELGRKWLGFVLNGQAHVLPGSPAVRGAGLEGIFCRNIKSHGWNLMLIKATGIMRSR